MTLPNFFIVGAPKAGTDELYYQLAQHPQIYMSPLKEPCFFSSEVRIEHFDEELQPRARVSAACLREYIETGAPTARFGGIITCLRDYQQLFLRVRNELAIGEGSVCYLWSCSAARTIAAAIPRARIIIVLMDPAERAFHQYLKSLSDRNVTHSFRTHMEMGLRDKREKMSVYHPFLEFGLYAQQVHRYKEQFPSEQINISLYDDRQADTEGWLKSILKFLGVDDSFVPNANESPSRPHIPRAKLLGSSVDRLKPGLGKLLPASLKSRMKGVVYKKEDELHLAPEDRATLVRFYRDDILKLQDIIGRDLSAWLRT